MVASGGKCGEGWVVKFGYWFGIGCLIQKDQTSFLEREGGLPEWRAWKGRRVKWIFIMKDYWERRYPEWSLLQIHP